MDTEEILDTEEVEEEENDTPEEEENSERTFTQAEVNQLIEARLARERKKTVNNNRIKTLTNERDSARSALRAKEEELETLHRERTLTSMGVAQDDVEYYAFKIGKLVTDEKSFEDAAKEFFKDGKNKVRVVDTGASMGSAGGRPPKSNEDIMNGLIRSAKK